MRCVRSGSASDQAPKFLENAHSPSYAGDDHSKVDTGGDADAYDPPGPGVHTAVLLSNVPGVRQCRFESNCPEYSQRRPLLGLGKVEVSDIAFVSLLEMG